RRVVVHRLIVRLERTVALAIVLGLVLILLVLLPTVIGSPPAPFAAGNITRRSCLPVGRRSRRRVVRLSRRAVAAAQFGKWIGLPQQTGKFGQGIASVCLLARWCRVGAPIRIIGAIGS